MSRIGKNPVTVPKEAKVEINERIISVEGPKGKLTREIPRGLSVEHKEGKIFVTRSSDTKFTKALHGLTRVLIANMIKGVIEGYSKALEIIGVGFRAEVKGDKLTMQLGFSHPVNFPIPQDIKIETPKQTQIVVSGIDKEKVGEIASEIRRIFPPEPYKGKGIRYAGEFVKKKIGKSITK
ncbi:MAG: 50S ribosomal protein L6 [Candidatus Omnitrophota bacterium]|nr:50S ribosomal protein L6 [Candidatus Omnitrophota bacterium]